MFDTRPGNARIAAYLIGAGLLGSLMALPMAATGRSHGDFLLLAAGCAAALVSGIWLLVRSRSRG